jgi:phosphoribosylamine--glycine ligase
MKINSLVIGSGAREHAIVRSISLSENCGAIYSLPGNPGINKIATSVNIPINNYLEIANFCRENNIDLVVIGPEQPLADGMSDALRIYGINVFGPSKYAAQLETSKSFAKDVMLKSQVPTASYKTFTDRELNEAIDYIKSQNFPLVIKADGLAAGKGVVIAENENIAISTVNEFFWGKFGQASKSILIEEFMYGDEASIFAITDGNDYILLPPAQDHKKILDGEKGKNTGGMGSYSPTNLINSNIMQKIENKIISPIINYMKSVGHPFIGCLYAGLIITPEKEPKVVEFNVRFGDPETQSVLNVIEGNFLNLLYTASIGKIDKSSIKQIEKAYAVTLVLASEGYPDDFEKGYEITGIEEAEQVPSIVYHAGTSYKDNKLVTNGGRVLSVTSKADNLFEAITNVYKAASKINFPNKYHRNDIGVKGIQYIEW